MYSLVSLLSLQCIVTLYVTKYKWSLNFTILTSNLLKYEQTVCALEYSLVLFADVPFLSPIYKFSIKRNKDRNNFSCCEDLNHAPLRQYEIIYKSVLDPTMLPSSRK